MLALFVIGVGWYFHMPAMYWIIAFVCLMVSR